MRMLLSRLVLLTGVLFIPTAAFAQAAIAGITKDASGAVLPGVTVEASSPALIEKVRTTVSDDRGLYRIVNLPPGTYVVTFTLQGFNVFKREGIELTGSFTAQVDAEMASAASQKRSRSQGHRRSWTSPASDARRRSAARS